MPEDRRALTFGEAVTCLDSMRVPIKEEERNARLGNVPYYGANGQVGWIDKPLFNEPLLLVAEDGGHFEEPRKGVAYAISGPSWVNNHAHVLRVNASVAMTEYLGYRLRNFDFLPYITGTTRSKLTQRDLMRVPISLPTLPEQKRIVRILDEAEELRRLRTEADRRTADLIPAIFHDMFGDPGTNPKGWPRVRLRDVSINKPNNGIFRKVDEYGSGLPVVWVEELFHDLNVDTSASRRLAATPEDVSKYGLKNGDLLFCRSSLVREGVGRVALFDGKSGSALFECHIIRLSPNKALVVPEYVVMYFRLPFGRERIMGQSRTATMTTVGQDDIAGLPITVPPLPLQCTFAARVAEVRAMEAEQAQSRRRLDDLFQALLRGLFAQKNWRGD